jgi:ABC-2 type transport system permease protein
MMEEERTTEAPAGALGEGQGSASESADAWVARGRRGLSRLLSRGWERMLAGRGREPARTVRPPDLRALLVDGLLDNPIVLKDCLSRMRSMRAPLTVTLYLGLLGAFGYAVFALASLFASGQRAGAAQIGTTVFAGLAFFQISLVGLFAPALAAGAISGERERQTLDVLLVSRVSAFGIVWGKLVASVAFMLLLILSALPLFAAVFLFGGVDIEQFVVTQLLTVTTAVALAAVSLCLSAAFRRTMASTVAAYGVAFAGVVGSLVMGLLLTLVLWQRQGGTGSLPEVHPLLFVNPLYAMGVVLNSPDGAPMHVGTLVGLLFMISGRGSGAGPALEPWQATVLVQGALIALSLVLAVGLVRGPRPPAQPPKAEAPEEVVAEG